MKHSSWRFTLCFGGKRALNKSPRDEIVEIEAFAKRTSGLRNQRAVDEWVDHLHASVYQKAAHSMAAVGMLAPLFESILCQSFSGIRRSFETNSIPFSSHPRWKLITKEQWDCHYVFTQSGGKKKKFLVKGVLQLADATGLTAHLPNDLRPTLHALFEYRNKMFHFELNNRIVGDRPSYAGIFNGTTLLPPDLSIAAEIVAPIASTARRIGSASKWA